MGMYVTKNFPVINLISLRCTLTGLGFPCFPYLRLLWAVTLTFVLVHVFPSNNDFWQSCPVY